MAYDPNAPNVNNAYQLDVEQIRENLNQLRVHETVVSASDIDSLPGLAPGMIIYVSSEKAYYGIFTDNLGNPMKVKLLTETGADKLDGYDAGNASGQIPISNGTLNTNLNADMVDGYDAGNNSGQIPISNGTLNTNLNADMVDGKHAVSFVHDPVQAGLVAGDDIFDLCLNGDVSNELVVTAGGTANAGSFNCILPPYKKLYIRRCRFYRAPTTSLIELRVFYVNNVWSTSSYYRDSVINYLLYDNNTSGSVNSTITFQFKNNDTVQHDIYYGLWFQFYII